MYIDKFENLVIDGENVGYYSNDSKILYLLVGIHERYSFEKNVRDSAKTVFEKCMFLSGIDFGIVSTEKSLKMEWYLLKIKSYKQLENAKVGIEEAYKNGNLTIKIEIDNKCKGFFK